MQTAVELILLLYLKLFNSCIFIDILRKDRELKKMRITQKIFPTNQQASIVNVTTSET